ncbi:uncharacterized protein LOC101458463 [Ceratitis capitata]|uniref:uncharacterized protein LOC101458463 n=1 Tax=Ceratitis capitata TaxID=7213 RepID=UPI00032A3F57|nr:uncharacterized protein LOC101458463 [Ceratitis capitata]
MSVISSEGKGRSGQVMEKLRTRKTPMRICNRRTRVSGDKKTQRRGGVIVTMSVEHSEGIALKTLEGVAEHHSRQISTTSALFGPMGVSIGVVCESTTENKEVVMDVQQLPNDNTQSATDWTGSISHYGASLKSMSRPSICELRKSLSFLEDQQFEKLAEFNIETTQQLLNIPIRKFLEIEINGEQLQLLMSLLENAFCKDSDQPKSFQEEVKSFEEIAGDIEKFEANDDDDEKPLVIDETFSIIEENQDPTTDKEERSLNDIEECFAKIRNVKIPQSRATIDEVKSELSEIIAELDGKEKRLLRRLKDKKQTDEPLVSAMKSGTEEVVTTTTASAQQNLQPTVLIKKLPTPLRKKQHDMDADSTTTGVDFAFLKIRKHENVADVGEAKKLRVNALQKKTRKRQAKVPNFVDNRDNKVPESSNISNEFLEVCSSDALDKVSQQSKAEEVHESQELKPVLKSVSPQSPLFESTPVKSEEFDESGIIMDTTITTQKEDNSERDNFSEGDLLATAPFSKTNENQIQCSTAKDSTNLSVTAQRRIEFDEKPNDKVSNLYDHYDADLIVTIDNTPLSPISGGITSPINSNNDYSPAMEIDGHCIGMIYLLKEIDMSGISVNKPDNLSMLLRTNGFDPRLSKYLKKEVNAVHTSTSICAFSKIAQSGDPRRTGSIYNTEKFSHQTPNMLIYGCLQRSPWYQSLMSTMKIQINQTISILVRAINNFQKIRLEDPYAVFDIFKLYCAGELLEILENLGLFVDVNGQITEKKNISTYAGRSYGCSSVVNATYSFIQPVEPSSVTVQHQQMRSFSSHAPNFSAMPFQPSASFQPPTPFISCYIESPHTPMENSVQMQQSRMRRPKPSQSRGPFEPPLPRRHCGLKVPYRNSAPPPLPSRSSLSPVKSIKPPTQSSNSDEECWDLDEEINSSTPSKLPLSPSSDDDSKQSRRNCTR